MPAEALELQLLVQRAEDQLLEMRLAEAEQSARGVVAAAGASIAEQERAAIVLLQCLAETRR